MFKRAKKKLEKENLIIDYIIETYAEQSAVDSRLYSYINEKAFNEEERKELLASLDCYNTLLYEHPMFARFKKQLFKKDKEKFVLTYLELCVCFLINTKKYYPEAIADILWIDKERLKDAVYSLENKMAKGGYDLPKGYVAMQGSIYEYFMVDGE